MTKEFYQLALFTTWGLIIGFILGGYWAYGTFRKTEVKVVKVPEVVPVDSDSIQASVKPDTLNKASVLASLREHNVSHPKIVLAQAILETGHFKSKVCLEKNNLFGLMRGFEYHSFNNWQDSVEFYRQQIQGRYRGGDYYAFLKEIKYAEDPEYINKLKQVVKCL